MKIDNDKVLALKNAINAGGDVSSLVDGFVSDIETEVPVAIARILNRRLLPRRKKYAETLVKASELGMSLEALRLFNAYSDGYNDRAIEIHDDMRGEAVIVNYLEDMPSDILTTATEAKAEVEGEAAPEEPQP